MSIAASISKVSHIANTVVSPSTWEVALECAGQGVWSVDPAADKYYFSDTWFTMRGFTPNDIEQSSFENWFERIHPDDKPRMLESITLERGGRIDVIHHEYRERHTNGNYIWILSRGKVTNRSSDGQALNTIGVDTDITGLKQNQERLQELAEKEHRWRVAVESAGQGVWDINHLTNVNYFSDEWRTIRGLGIDEPEPLTSEDWMDTVHPDDREQLKEEIAARATVTSNDVCHEYRQRHKNGSWVWIMSRGKVVERDSTGKIIRMIGTDTDVTALKNSENEFGLLARRHELAISVSKMGIWEVHLATNRVFGNKNTREIFEETSSGGEVPVENYISGEAFEKLIHPQDRKAVNAAIMKAIGERGNYDIDYRLLLSGGEVRYVRSRAGFHEDKINGARLVGTIWDISDDVKRAQELQQAKEFAEKKTMEIQAAQKSLQHNALHDALTGLPNRRQLDNALDGIKLQNGTARTKKIALLHIDLDRFKQINDTMGHIAGDTVLQKVAKILESYFVGETIVSRTGGDEFVILLLDAPDDEQLTNIANRLLQLLGAPITIDDSECLLGASIGLATDIGGKVSGRKLLINADIALYRAKNEGRNRYCFFTPDMQQQTIEHKKCADDIKRGFMRNEFVPFYQLQFDARTHDVSGVEALARWRHPERGILTPIDFMAIVEEMNLSARLDEIILEQALQDFSAWKQAGVNIPHISVNVSARRLADSQLIKNLRKLEIPADCFSFELLESIFLDNQSDIVANNLTAIRAMGIGIEIDDFGTGHASIACLHSLRPNKLKIDRQLVMPLRASVEMRRLLASIVDIGSALGIEVLAEGVESFEHARILADLGCNYLQGFAFARPMESKDLMSFVADQTWRKAA